MTHPVTEPIVTNGNGSLHRLVQSKHVRHHVHGEGRLGHFNSQLAVLVTQSVGSVWCAYIFVLIALISFPQALAAFVAGDRITGITWLSQSFLQLVLLPVLMVGQRVISASQDARAETDHEVLVALHQINLQQLEILNLLKEQRSTSVPARKR